MLDRGVEIIALPAAFTALTGRAHWEVLLRSRAIENQCFVAAAAQSGVHGNGRETWGDSMIVDPWGAVIDRLERGPGAVCAHCDREQLQRIRRSFPALDHRRELDRASGKS
jgi:predicted amidohydrolase